MKKSELLKIIKEEILSEVLDLVSVNNIPGLQSKQIGDELKYIFTLEENTFVFSYNQQTHEFIYGIYDPKTKTISVTHVLNSGKVFKIIPYVFSLIRYVIDDRNLTFVKFQADDSMRQGLYKIMMDKYFTDFKIDKYGNEYELHKK